MEEGIGVAVEQNSLALMAAERLRVEHPTVLRKLNYLANELARLGLIDTQIRDLLEVFVIGLNNGLRGKHVSPEAQARGNRPPARSGRVR